MASKNGKNGWEKRWEELQLYIRENEKRMQKSDERWKALEDYIRQNEDRWRKNDEKWQNNEEKWQKSEEKWQKLEQRNTVMLHMLQRQMERSDKFEARAESFFKIILRKLEQ